MASEFLSSRVTSAVEPSVALPTQWAAASGAMTAGRFRLYVSYACPWSHRVLIARTLNRLDDAVDIVEVDPVMDSVGWRLGGGHLLDQYRRYAHDYSGKATVPLMVDAATGLAVSNESADLMRMLGTTIIRAGRPLYPVEHALACDAWNHDLHVNVNAAVYRGGLAASEETRRHKTDALTKTLSRLDRVLADRPFLIDDRPLEPDWRLWVSLARYDLAYRPFLLSADAVPLSAFIHLERFFTSLLEVPRIAETYHPHEIVAHYAARLRDLKSPAPTQKDTSS